ncbi:MAG: heavy metal transporter [Clostridiales bacterium]|nr:heavy metal transporter [Clostridiales bacterium]
MKKVYILEGLDCAHCAGKIQEEVSKLDGVIGCTVAFLTQKMTIDMEDSKVGQVAKAAIKIVNKLEPDVEVSEK